MFTAKPRSSEDVSEAIQAGIKTIGYNYIQEAESIRENMDIPVQWQMTGHLQRNKAKKAVRLFDMIETMDSVRLAEEVNKHCAVDNKVMPVLMEVNIGKESNKTCVLPEHVEKFILQIHELPNLAYSGIDDHGPLIRNPEDARPYFKITRSLFEDIKKRDIPHVEMRYLSMRMSNSYI